MRGTPACIPLHSKNMSKPPVPSKIVGEGDVVDVNFPLKELYFEREWQKLGLIFEWDPSAFPPSFIVVDIKGSTLAERVAHFQGCVHVNRSRLVAVNGSDLRIVQNQKDAKQILEEELKKTLEYAKDLVLGRKYCEPGSDLLTMTFLNPPRPDGYIFGVKKLPFYGQSESSRSLRPKTADQRLKRLLSEPALRPLSSSRSSNGIHYGGSAMSSRHLTGKSYDRKMSSMRSRSKSAKSIFKPPTTRYGTVHFRGGKFNKDIRPLDRPVEMVNGATSANPSATGKQVLSTLRNSTAISIGFSTREEWKIMMEGKKASDGSVPISFSAFGKQVSSDKKNGRNAQFGCAKRQLPPFRGLDKGMDSPGPVLMMPSTLGAGRLSFGAGARKTISTDTGLDSPGPVYDPIFLDAIGRDPDKGCSFGETVRPLSKTNLYTTAMYDQPVYFGPGVSRIVGPKVISTSFGKKCRSEEERKSQRKFYYGSSADLPVNHDVLWKARVKEELRCFHEQSRR